MSRAQKITNIGGVAMTGAYNVVDVDDPGPRPLLNLVPLPNGAVHDPNGTSAATLAPADKITVTVMIKINSYAVDPEGDFNTAVAALEALRGTHLTLTGEDSSGTTLTCTARMSGMPYFTTRQTHEQYHETYRLEFIPKTDWS